MDPSAVSLTSEELSRLASVPGNEVYVNSFAHEFNPWDPLRILECIRVISSATASGSLMPETPELIEFREFHPTLYTASQSRDPRVIQFLHTMLETRMACNAGTITAELAAIRIIDGIRENGTVTSG